MTEDLKKLLRETFEYSMTDVHTSFPGTVVKYDPKTRRADIQPSLKRRIPDGSFIDFPVIPEVPVQFFGTKHCTIHVPLEKDDEVAVHVIERGTDIWRDQGGNGIEDKDPRRFNLQDCYATPGLQPVDFPETPEKGLSIIYKDFKANVIDDMATMEFKNVKAETDGSEIKSSWKEHAIEGDIEVKGKVDIEGNVTIKGNITPSGGKLDLSGQPTTPGSGVGNLLPNCLFTGAPHNCDGCQYP